MQLHAPKNPESDTYEEVELMIEDASDQSSDSDNDNLYYPNGLIVQSEKLHE